jgi:small subunit ribosomal protein S21
MLIVEVDKKGNIEKALKELKSKVIKTRQNSLLNERKEFTKKSVQKRQQKIKAIYVQKKFKSND